MSLSCLASIFCISFWIVLIYIERKKASPQTFSGHFFRNNFRLKKLWSNKNEKNKREQVRQITFQQYDSAYDSLSDEKWLHFKKQHFDSVFYFKLSSAIFRRQSENLKVVEASRSSGNANEDS